MTENAYLCNRKTNEQSSESHQACLNGRVVKLEDKVNMVPVVQLVRASDCGSECRRFESVRAPQKKKSCNPRGYGTFIFRSIEF